MKFHNRVLLQLVPADHNSGIKRPREVYTSLCIDVLLRASPCMHPAQVHGKPKWGEAFIRHREEVVRAARGGESMCFWLKSLLHLFFLSFTLISHESYCYIPILPRERSQEEPELLLWWRVGWQRHVEYKYNHCRVVKTCSFHHWDLISTGSVVCVLFLREK